MQQFHLIPGQEHNKTRNSDLCKASELNHVSILFPIFISKYSSDDFQSSNHIDDLWSFQIFTCLSLLFCKSLIYNFFSQELNAINFWNGETKTTQ